MYEGPVRVRAWGPCVRRTQRADMTRLLFPAPLLSAAGVSCTPGPWD